MGPYACFGGGWNGSSANFVRHFLDNFSHELHGFERSQPGA